MMEGLSSAGNIQGALMNALIAILKLKSIPNVLKWVNDFVFFHVPSLFHQIHIPVHISNMTMTFQPYYQSQTYCIFHDTQSNPKAKISNLQYHTSDSYGP